MLKIKRFRLILIEIILIFPPAFAFASGTAETDYQQQMQRPVQLMTSVSQAHHCGFRGDQWTQQATALLLSFAFAGAEKEWPGASPDEASTEAQQQAHLINIEMVAAAAAGAKPTANDCQALLNSGDLDTLDAAVKYMDAHENDGQ